MDQTTVKNDDIDLLQFFKQIISFISRYWKLIFGFAFVGLLLGILSFLTAPKLYPSSLIVHSALYTNQEQIHIIKNWSALLKAGEYESMARSWNCSVEMVKKVKKLSAEEIMKAMVQNNPNGFKLEVLVTDPAVLDSLETSIVWGLENNTYIRERIAVKRFNYQEMIKKVNDEIEKLDSTKTVVDNLMRTAGANTPSLILDVSGINTQLISLHEKLLHYQEELKFVNPVHVLQSFSKFTKPKSPVLVKSLGIGIVAGSFIGFLLALFSYIRTKLRSRRMA
jgi:hypothetical protein